MLKLIMLKGLPASGKSTWAKAQTENRTDIIRFNNDEIRAMFNKGKFTKELESLVTSLRVMGIRHALENNKSVIIDNTNLNPIHEEQYKEMAIKYNAIFEIKEFPTPMDECIKRDQLRANPVGEQVIREMAEKYSFGLIPNKYSPVLNHLALPSVFIFDIDGTLAKKSDLRGYHDYDKVQFDTPIQPVVELMNILELSGNKVIFVSGRKDSCYDETKMWIKLHKDLYAEPELYMRKSDDNRPDDIVKREILEELVKKYYIAGVFDDRNRVVDMWRQSGIQTYQCNYGNF